MAKTKSKPDPQAEETKRSTLSAFFHHQGAALEEAGKAVASLFPKEFRSHTRNAIKEGTTGFTVLVDGMVDGIERGLDKLRCTASEDAESAGNGKVKVEVEGN